MEIIAELGSTHQGNRDTMRALIYAAAEAGATCVKQQWMSDPAAVVTRRRVPARYREYYDWLRYPIRLHDECRAFAEDLGLRYLCSVYLPSDVALLAQVVSMLKVSSFEAADPEMREAVGDIPAIISCGMEPNPAGLAAYWWPAQALHCVSAYPAPLSSLHLHRLREPWCAGLSDHARNVRMGGYAVMAGARIIEAHLRLDTCDPAHPDYAVSFSPAEFTTYVQHIHEACAAYGATIMERPTAEAEMQGYRVQA